MSALALIDQTLARIDRLLAASPARPLSSVPTTAAPAPEAAPAKAPAAVDVSQFLKAKIQVGKLLSVEKPENSEKLFKCQVDLGNGVTRQLVTGLVGFYTEQQLRDRLIMTIVNLKAATLAGLASEAMLLAGENMKDGKLQVLLLEPPAASQIGDLVYLEGHTLPKEFPDQINRKQWEKIVKDSFVQDEVASYSGVKWVTSKGHVTCPGAPNGAGIH
eukprot:c3639_g1_i2.p1 GENE.c3639_g1_i2~~c3639_g1_i2.p1  ORF type:complete len:217 (-),score=48.49 c3639_g1_i2:39-689(-)